MRTPCPVRTLSPRRPWRSSCSQQCHWPMPVCARHVHGSLSAALAANGTQSPCGSAANAETLVPTVLVGCAIATMLLGVAFFALGAGKLTGVVGFVPANVTAGFLSCIGYKVIKVHPRLHHTTHVGASTTTPHARSRWRCERPTRHTAGATPLAPHRWRHTIGAALLAPLAHSGAHQVHTSSLAYAYAYASPCARATDLSNRAHRRPPHPLTPLNVIGRPPSRSPPACRSRFSSPTT